MKKNLKEIHINETNILLEGNMVKGGILPGKIAELTRTVTIQADLHNVSCTLTPMHKASSVFKNVWLPLVL